MLGQGFPGELPEGADSGGKLQFPPGPGDQHEIPPGGQILTCQAEGFATDPLETVAAHGVSVTFGHGDTATAQVQIVGAEEEAHRVIAHLDALLEEPGEFPSSSQTMSFLKLSARHVERFLSQRVIS
jgi:hypothetical protein